MHKLEQYYKISIRSRQVLHRKAGYYILRKLRVIPWPALFIERIKSLYRRDASWLPERHFIFPINLLRSRGESFSLVSTLPRLCLPCQFTISLARIMNGRTNRNTESAKGVEIQRTNSRAKSAKEGRSRNDKRIKSNTVDLVQLDSGRSWFDDRLIISDSSAREIKSSLERTEWFNYFFNHLSTIRSSLNIYGYCLRVKG